MEDVWTYPRPPALQPVLQRLRIVFGGQTIADTTGAFRVLETSHPPVYYLPPSAFAPGTLHPAPGGSLCEWKGRARYWTIRANGYSAERAGWSYPNPEPAFADMADYIAVYAGTMDACYVDEEKVTPQPGGFYGGWITANLRGPFKGVSGSMGW